MRRVLRSCISIWLLIAAAVHAAEFEVRVVENGEKRPIAVEAIGLSRDVLADLAKSDPSDPFWSQRFTVFVLDDMGRLQLPALAGRREVVGDAIRFTPQF